jgi:ADP-ribosylglycohydrolase
MRTAALGLLFLSTPERLASAVADVSRITHQDARSIAGGVAVAKAAQLLAGGPADDPHAFCLAISEAMAPYAPAFAESVTRLPALAREPPEVALPLIAWSGMERPEFGTPIITPFVIPTVLAALWCLLRHGNAWSQAVAGAIRLGGDVDTLGAIVGALAGVAGGVHAIPPHLSGTVQQSNQFRTLALRYHALAVGLPPS